MPCVSQAFTLQVLYTQPAVQRNCECASSKMTACRRGAWSLIKRSVQYKPIKKIYVTEGPAKGKEVLPCCPLNLMPLCDNVDSCVRPDWFIRINFIQCSDAANSFLDPALTHVNLLQVRQTAAEITAYFRALNFTPEPSKETVIFRCANAHAHVRKSFDCHR